jgi:hypothetical protein
MLELNIQLGWNIEMTPLTDSIFHLRNRHGIRLFGFYAVKNVEYRTVQLIRNGAAIGAQLEQFLLASYTILFDGVFFPVCFVNKPSVGLFSLI